MFDPDVSRTLLLGAVASALGLAVCQPAMAAEPINLGVGEYTEHWAGWANREYDTSGDTEGASFDAHSDTEVWFKGPTKLDNGITVGFRVDLDEEGSIRDELTLKIGAFGVIDLGGDGENLDARLGDFDLDGPIRFDDEGDLYNFVPDPLEQSYDKEPKPAGPDMETFRKNLRGAINTRANLRQRRSPGSQTDDLPEAYDEGPDLRDKARKKAGEARTRAARTRPKPKPRAAARHPAAPSGAAATTDGGAPHETPDTPPGTAVTGTSETPHTTTAADGPAPPRPPIENVHEERGTHQAVDTYDCSVKPYTGPTRNKQAQQALIDNYNAHCN